MNIKTSLHDVIHINNLKKTADLIINRMVVPGSGRNRVGTDEELWIHGY